MTGAEALRYARSRHGSNDFDRGARQQRVLLSLREQADPQALIPRLPELVKALKQAVKTDIPANQLAPLLGLASRGRHQEHPLVRVRAAVLRRRSTCDARAATSSSRTSAGSARRSRTRSRPTRPTRRSARALGRGGGRGLGPQRHRATRGRGDDASPATSTTTAWPRRRRARSRRAPSRPTRRSSSTTAPRPSCPRRSPTSRDVRGDGHDRRPTRRSGPTSSSPSAKTTPEPRGAAARPDAPAGRRRRAASRPLLDRREPVAVLGQAAADRVEVAVADEPRRSGPISPDADRPVVDLDDRRDLDAGPAQEHLVGDVQLGAVDRADLDRDALVRRAAR